MTNSASWKWGELPTKGDENKEGTTDESKQAQRNSMLSGMFSFMKQSKKMRKSVPEGVYLEDLDAEGMDPEVSLFFIIFFLLICTFLSRHLLRLLGPKINFHSEVPPTYLNSKSKL